MPLIPGKDNTALAILLSKESNKLPPNPFSMPSILTSTIPPTESPVLEAFNNSSSLISSWACK